MATSPFPITENTDLTTADDLELGALLNAAVAVRLDDENATYSPLMRAISAELHERALVADKHFDSRRRIMRDMRITELNGWLHKIGKPSPGVITTIRHQALDELHERALNEDRLRTVRLNLDLPGMTVQELNKVRFELVRRLSDYDGVNGDRLHARLGAAVDELHARALEEDRHRSS